MKVWKIGNFVKFIEREFAGFYSNLPSTCVVEGEGGTDDYVNVSMLCRNLWKVSENKIQLNHDIAVLD